ncbi:HD family phosphohydrolase [Mycobacteroides salmoniphilum]|uniref:HD family phosphohydrolase n=1 Tax=Mycobacteroides salmoniphilum TaxID=404941 RepID=UPI001064EFA3|nr:HD family phosphohydrolase [Mycobacteroides salmoniphilum]TDZ99316.1 hypothetical protein CCUG62472_00554 [Mycobacteroides salmoniphilum]
MKTSLELSPLIDEVLDKHRRVRQPTSHDDWNGYRNHAQRVYLFGRELLRQCDINDRDADEKLAIAAAFHDIHVFETLDYLVANNQSLRTWLNSRGKQHWFPEIATAMTLHHRLRPYRGEHAWLVEALRKADWIEVALGRIRNGVPRYVVREAHRLLPTNDFAKTSAKRIALHALADPTNPFPFWRSGTALQQIT